MRLLALFKFDANSASSRHEVVAHQLRNSGFLLPTDDLERSQFMTLLVEDLDPATQAQQPPRLVSCEARERAGSEGFLFAQWRSGTMKFRQFLFEQRRATFIVPFLVIGLATQIVLTLRPQHGNEVWELALRLSGPMFVTSLVLILERWAQWRDQVQPMLRWSTSRPEGKTPLTPD
jgi:hypothetical protein